MPVSPTCHPVEPRTLFAAPPPSAALNVVPTIQVVIDYSLDANNFFNTQLKRDLLQQAADSVAKWFTDSLLAITPSGGDSWDAVLDNPATGLQQTLANPTIGANQVLLFAGGRDMTDALGRGGPGGYQARGTAAWRDRVALRGQSAATGSPEIAPWGGAITFDTNPASPWHFGQTTSGLGGANDFLSVATHEVTHLLGFGTSDAWSSQVVGTTHRFDGPASVALYDGAGNVPLHDDDAHWANGTTDEGQETAMDPLITLGTRHLLTPLDYAGLDDIGWSMPPRVSGVTAANVATPGATTEQFSVIYTHYAALDASTLDAADISVVTPAGATLPASVVSSTSSGGGTTRTVTYSVAAPGGAWDVADNGTYSIVLNANQVRGTTGEAVAPGTLGSFVADVADVPVGVLQTVAQPAPGSAAHTIVVVYTDAVAVDPSTIDANDITVTDPAGANVPVVAAAVDSAAPGTPRIATYTLAAPGGSWGPEDDGVYTVSLRGGEVADTSGNVSAAVAANTFEVTLGSVAFDARTPAVYTDLTGHRVKVTLKGPGTGRVRLASLQPANAVGIDVDGTTAASTLSIKCNPATTTVGGVTINGSLKSLSAKAVGLTGGLSASGTVGALRLSSATGGSVSAAGFGSIVARTWATELSAASFLNKMKVTLLEGNVFVGGSIGTISAGRIEHVHIFAGVRDDLATDLPQSLADFANPAASIRAVVARTSNTPLVAAPTVGRMSFGTMSSPGGGIAADRVALVSGRPSDLTPPFRFRDLDAPGAASHPWVDLRIL